MHTQNSQVSHSVFTQKHKLSGDAYPCLVETPAFGHSVNHVGLQLADLVASSVVFPMASRTYCADHWTGPHVHPHYDGVKQRWASRVRLLQHRYRDDAGFWRGGLVVSDKLGRRPGERMFVAGPNPLDEPLAAAL